MRNLREWLHRAAGTLSRRRRDEDLEEELRLHLEMATDAARQSDPQDDGRRAARLRAGGVAQAMEALRDQRGIPSITDVVRDMRHAIRGLYRRPGFSAVALFTIALGIGANAAMFTIVYGVLLKPLSYPDAERLVRVYQTNPALGVMDGAVSPPDFDDWQSHTRAWDGLAATQASPILALGLGEPVELEMAVVTGDFFGTLGTTPVIGRAITHSDIRDAIPLAVISERLWRGALGGDPAVLGRTLRLGVHGYTIVGVVPTTFRYPSAGTDVWTPRTVLGEEEIGPYDRGQRVLDVIGRLRTDVNVEEAHAELQALAAHLAVEHPASNAAWQGVAIVPLHATVVGSAGPVLVVVFAAVTALLLIVCANLANMLLARGAARRREMAVRVAIGASRTRVVRQLLTESGVLGFCGGVLGIAVAAAIVRTVVRLGEGTLPRLDEVHLDGWVLTYTLLLSIVAGLVCGLPPALATLRRSLAVHLADGRAVVSRSTSLQRGLIVVEVAIAVVLVVAAGLVARSFLALQSADPGFAVDNALAVVMPINLADVEQPVEHIAQRRREWIERVSALPGVTGVGTITSLPMQDRCRDFVEFTRSDGEARTGTVPLRADNCLVSSGYLHAMGIPLLRGAHLPDVLTAGAPVPFLVSEAAARRFWPGEDPLGKIVMLQAGGRGEAVVTGVVGDVHQTGLRDAPTPTVYFPQAGGPRIVATLVVRTHGDPESLIEPIRTTVRHLDANQAIRSVSTLRAVVADAAARDRFLTFLFAVFGTLALVLAAVGVYGVLSHAVAERTREIGVRMALGANRRNVVGMVAGQAATLVVAGLALGLAGAVLVTRLMTSLLYQTSAHDAVTLVGVCLVLTTAAVVASVVPAWRAARVLPSIALRMD